MIEANEKDPLNLSNRKISPSKIPGQTKNEKRSSILYSSMSMNTMQPSSYNLQNRQLGGEKYSSICASFDDLVTFEHSSKALVNCFIAFFIYLAIGAVTFSYILSDKWPVIDSMYFAVATFTTCGYGDVHPVDSVGMIVTIIFLLGGVIALGIVLGIIGQNLLGMDNKRRKCKEQKFINRLWAGEATESTENIPDDNDLISEEIIEILKNVGPYLFFIIGCSLFIGFMEGWDIVTSIYYCVVTATSVGYGDIAPKTQSMRLFAVLFIPFSIAVMAEFVARVASLYIDRKVYESEQEFLSRKMTVKDFENMDTDGDGFVTHEEFICFMLLAMGKVEKECLDEIKRIFISLDTNSLGKIQRDELVNLAIP